MLFLGIQFYLTIWMSLLMHPYSTRKYPIPSSLYLDCTHFVWMFKQRLTSFSPQFTHSSKSILKNASKILHEYSSQVSFIYIYIYIFTYIDLFHAVGDSVYVCIDGWTDRWMDGWIFLCRSLQVFWKLFGPVYWSCQSSPGVGTYADFYRSCEWPLLRPRILNKQCKTRRSG